MKHKLWAISLVMMLVLVVLGQSSAFALDQWASSVIGYSSAGFSASLALGLPDDPGYGDNTNCWAQANPYTSGWISLGYTMPVYSTGCVIVESRDNGLVTRIDAIKEDDTAVQVWSSADSAAAGVIYYSTFRWPTTQFKVKGLKIYIAGDYSRPWPEIDAVRLSGTTYSEPGSVSILGYKFNESSGVYANSNGLSSTVATMYNYAGTPTDLHRSNVALSDRPNDKIFDNASVTYTGTTGMGQGYVGGTVSAGATSAMTGLTSMTLSGWFCAQSGVPISGYARLFDTGGFQLAARNNGELYLELNNPSTRVYSQPEYDSTNGVWTFFAVTWDGTIPQNNVRFYIGGINSPVAQVGDPLTLANNPLPTASNMYIGNSSGSNYPFDGWLDNMRVFGSTSDSRGALSLRDLESYRRGEIPQCLPDEDQIVRNVRDFGATGDGVTDDTVAIQKAIGTGHNVVYFPSGTYVVSSEIKVTSNTGGTRLVGDYSGVRPVIKLKANTPGYNGSNLAYVVRFYQNPDGTQPANGDTFASQWDGIDIVMESGNPMAVGIDHQGAQNSYIRNCNITMDGNRAGIGSVPADGLIENVKIDGGIQGAYAGTCGWPATFKGCKFTNQEQAGIVGVQGGMVVEGCVFDGCGWGIMVSSSANPSDPSDRISVENCIFKNIGNGKAILGTMGTLSDWMVTIKNTYFNNVPYIAYWDDSPATYIAGQSSGWCRADYVTHGRRWSDRLLANVAGTNYAEITSSVSQPTFTEADYVDHIPNKFECVNVLDYGAVGDGVHDDTQAISDAIASSTEPIWFPMGTYKISDTITLDSDTKLMGEASCHVAINLVPVANDVSFNNSASPKPLIDTVDDASGTAILSGMFFGRYFDDTSTANTVEFDGLINIRWRVGRNSIVDDVMCMNYSFVTPPYIKGYSALVITGNGGGHFRQVWTPWDSYSGPGTIYIKGTTEPMYLYGMSPEHSPAGKPAVCIEDSSNVTFRQLQAEWNQGGVVKASRCDNLVFNNVLYSALDYGSVAALDFDTCSNIEVNSLWHTINTGYTYYQYDLKDTQNGTTTTVPSAEGFASYKRTSLFYDGFESNNFTAGGWTNSGCILSATYSYYGSYAVEFNNSDSLTKALSTVGYSNIRIWYGRMARQCESNDYLICECSTDGGSNWTQLESTCGNYSWTARSFDLPAAASNNANLQFRFRTSHNGSDDYAYIDDVYIFGTADATVNLQSVYSIMQQSWYTSMGDRYYDSRADLNKDGTVEDSDYAALNSLYIKSK